ncbi:hypothetical protein GYMLUDRAFT_924592 [Collybiopsis luxurians FD-317 M1]|uniref:Uncharacterized protein n=1 Tax=Collybiopsis luxurians FD-317 M1 TaxID=944289 RepID=A0A0D0BW40_9AGAR|nr:hypothetical protein GYMLUDRAFT_924592 [Collybiopsis luxurians FD-317 M1]
MMILFPQLRQHTRRECDLSDFSIEVVLVGRLISNVIISCQDRIRYTHYLQFIRDARVPSPWAFQDGS